MTVPASFLASQLDSLARSLAALATLCKERLPNAGLNERLVLLASRVAIPSGAADTLPSLEHAADILSQAQASIKLLDGTGHLESPDGDSLASSLASTLSAVEAAVGGEMRKGPTSRVYGLYVIIDPEVTAGRDPAEVAGAALAGGARMIQLRDKLSEKGRSLRLARMLLTLCSNHDALFIVNDHADLAAIVGADGLHVGQGDLPVAEARAILNTGQIIGRSNHLVEEVTESEAQGADHVALGAVYQTSTKASISDRATIGPEAVRRARESVHVPLVAIGGINEDNVEPVVRAGADAICVTGAVGLAPDPEAACRRMVSKILQAGGRA